MYVCTHIFLNDFFADCSSHKASNRQIGNKISQAFGHVNFVGGIDPPSLIRWIQWFFGRTDFDLTQHVWVERINPTCLFLCVGLISFSVKRKPWSFPLIFQFSTHLKNISQIRSVPHISGWKKNMKKSLKAPPSFATIFLLLHPGF